MESPALYKLTRGYLPYTLIPILITLCIVALSNSWAAVLAGGVIFIILSSFLVIFQLVIFKLPTKSKMKFHLYCFSATLFNIFITPTAIGALLRALVR